MHKGKEVSLVLAGVLAGTAIACPGASAAAGILAERSTNEVYVNGQRVDLEAYAIGGHNYVKLRDVGKAVNFNVYWDGTVQIDRATPYTGEAPVAEVAPTLAEAIGHSAQANPAVFTGVYNKEIYDAMRSAILTGEGKVVNADEATKTALESVAAAVGCYPAYDVSGIKIIDHAIVVKTRYPAPYEGGAKVCKAFLSSLTGTDRDKLTAMAAYVCDRLEYDVRSTTTPANLFTEPGPHRGACMSYALGLKFLCDLEGIPCILVHSENHQWNEVYVEGTWYAVDLANYDGSYTRGTPGTLLTDPATLQWNPYRQIEPELTAFAREVVAPGSTK